MHQTKLLLNESNSTSHPKSVESCLIHGTHILSKLWAQDQLIIGNATHAMSEGTF